MAIFFPLRSCAGRSLPWRRWAGQRSSACGWSRRKLRRGPGDITWLVGGDWNIRKVGLLTYQNGCFMGFNGWLVVWNIWVCLKMVSTTLKPMVFMIIIPFLNGYFIGNINPTFSDKPIWIIFPFSWECHHPNWRSHIFQRGRDTTSQLIIVELGISCCWQERREKQEAFERSLQVRMVQRR